MDTEILEDLGLTHTEIKVYLTLLRLGSASAGAILEKSRLPNSTLHRDLNSLIEKGLINFVLEGKRKLYQATDPNSFFDFIEEKKRKFKEILPELQRQQNIQQVKEKATIYKGVRGVKEAYNIMVNTKGKEYNTFGGGPVTVDVMGGLTWWLNLHERRIANKLPARQVWDLAVANIEANQIASKPMTNIRYLSHEFAGFQETVIVGGTVSINVFTEIPYSFIIVDSHVAESYKKYFEILWKMAKPSKH